MLSARFLNNYKCSAVVKIKNEPLGADEIAKSSTITNHEIDRSHEKSDVLNDISCSELLYTLRQLGIVCLLKYKVTFNNAHI